MASLTPTLGLFLIWRDVLAEEASSVQQGVPALHQNLQPSVTGLGSDVLNLWDLETSGFCGYDMETPNTQAAPLKGPKDLLVPLPLSCSASIAVWNNPGNYRKKLNYLA